MNIQYSVGVHYWLLFLGAYLLIERLIAIIVRWWSLLRRHRSVYLSSFGFSTLCCFWLNFPTPLKYLWEIPRWSLSSNWMNMITLLAHVNNSYADTHITNRRTYLCYLQEECNAQNIHQHNLYVHRYLFVKYSSIHMNIYRFRFHSSCRFKFD